MGHRACWGLVVALLVSGCAFEPPPDAYVFYADSSLTAEQVAVVQEAARLWERAVPVEIEVRIGPVTPDLEMPEQTGYVLAVEKDDRRCAGHDLSALAGKTESYDGWRGYVCVRENVFLPRVIAHEMGHFMGLAHVDGLAIMNPMVEGMSPAPTCLDLRVWNRARKLPVPDCIPPK